MLHEEYGLASGVRSPVRAATSTFLAFFLFGSIPLLPFLLRLPHPFLWASLFTGAAFFLIGSLKSRWSLKSWWYSAATTLFVGTIAAALAYAAGYVFSHCFA